MAALLLAPARAVVGRVLSGAFGLATAPARVALGALELIVEQVDEAIRSDPSRDRVVLSDSEPGEDAPPAVTPSVARAPASKRRRTAIRDPRPPVARPGLLDPTPPPADAPATVEPDDAPPPQHVDAGETLVAEVADPGAETGASAELHVSEPWPGYGTLRAGEIVDRLAAQDAAALSVLLLYEREHRARKSVLESAERELARRG